MKNPKEHKEHRIWKDESIRVAYAVEAGVADEEAALWMLAETENVTAEQGDQVDWLLDLSAITKTTSKGRKI